MPDLNVPSQETFNGARHYVTKFVYPVIEEVVNIMVGRIQALEEKNAMRTAARVALREAGHKEPSDVQVARVVDEFILRRLREPREGLPCVMLDWSQPVEVLGDRDGRTVTKWNPAQQKAALTEEEPTREPERRLEAHAKHLRGLEERVKRIERGAQ